MRRHTYAIILAFTMLALLGLAGSVRADDPIVRFQTTFTGSLLLQQSMPLNPPQISVIMDAQGTSELGNYHFVGRHIVNMGQFGLREGDIRPTRVSEGNATFTWENGDSIFLSYGGMVTLTRTPGVFTATVPFAITGGRGTFLGASGSGLAFITHDLTGQQVSTLWTGTDLQGAIIVKPPFGLFTLPSAPAPNRVAIRAGVRMTPVTVAARATVAQVQELHATIPGGFTGAEIHQIEPPLVTAVGGGAGPSNFGPMTFVARRNVRLGRTGPGGDILNFTVVNFEGQGRLIAADGDSIFVQFGGIARPTDVPTVLIFTGGFEITGGTGRFSGASGSGTLVSNDTNVITQTATVIYDGVIITPGTASASGVKKPK